MPWSRRNCSMRSRTRLYMMSGPQNSFVPHGLGTLRAQVAAWQADPGRPRRELGATGVSYGQRDIERSRQLAIGNAAAGREERNASVGLARRQGRRRRQLRALDSAGGRVSMAERFGGLGARPAVFDTSGRSASAVGSSARSAAQAAGFRWRSACSRTSSAGSSARPLGPGRPGRRDDRPRPPSTPSRRGTSSEARQSIFARALRPCLLRCPPAPPRLPPSRHSGHRIDPPRARAPAPATSKYYREGSRSHADATSPPAPPSWAFLPSRSTGTVPRRRAASAPPWWPYRAAVG